MQSPKSVMSTIQPASPPFRSEDRSRTCCYVDIDRRLKQASWPYIRGGPAFPDFSTLDRELGIVISDLQLTQTVLDLWKGSELLGYGSDACIRLTDSGSHPVIKLAHPKAECRQRIEHEFEVMRRLAHLDVVARVHHEPFTDEDGIVGFRLERLQRITKDESTAKKEEIKGMLTKLHEAGYCHGDIHFCNIMQRQSGELVLIDFAYAGRLGEAVPGPVPKYMHPSRVYCVVADWERLDGRYI